MDLFKKAFEETVGIEGGYVDDPDDRGGETKFGISKRSYPELDIKNLTLREAWAIYYKDYWNTKKGNLDSLPDSIAIEVFDTAVNMGMTTARKMLQESLNILNRNELKFIDLDVDGYIGIKTFKAVDLVLERKLLKTLNGFQFCAYKEFAQNNPKQEKFFAGWIERT